MEDSLKLTNTQRRLLAAASQRDDGAPKRPSHLTGGAAGKVVAKLLAEGLIEEIQCRAARMSPSASCGHAAASAVGAMAKPPFEVAPRTVWQRSGNPVPMLFGLP